MMPSYFLLVRSALYCCCCFLATAIAPATLPAPALEAATATDERLAEQAFALVNQYRSSRGFPLLIWNDAIAEVSRTHSSNMAAKKVGFGHKGFDKRASQLRDNLECSSVGENVAYGKNISVEQIVQNWIKSPVHKQNIEGTYRLSGIGVARDKQGRIYYTQIFAN